MYKTGHKIIVYFKEEAFMVLKNFLKSILAIVVCSQFFIINPNVTTTYACFHDINRVPIEEVSLDENLLVEPMAIGCSGYDSIYQVRVWIYRKQFGFMGFKTHRVNKVCRKNADTVLCYSS